MKVLLVLPPQWIPERPYLSLPSLTGFLRREGVEVVQKDVNIEAYEILLSKKYLNSLSGKLERRFAQIEAKGSLAPGLEQGYYNDLFMARSFCSDIADRVEAACQTLRDPDILDDVAALKVARDTLDQALAIVSMAFYPTKIELSGFRMPVFSGSMRDLERLTRSEEMNPYLGLFRNHFLPWIREQKPDVVGLTIAGQSQQIPALTLARLIKSLPQAPHIVVGGHVVTMLGDTLTKNKDLFDLFFDSAVRFDGERPLLELVKRLENGESLSSVPNLVFRDIDGIHVNEIQPPEDIDSLPTPDFDGLPLDKYLTPAPVLPLQSSRGCYWGKCAFCTHSLAYGKRYQPRDPSLVVDDLDRLQQKYGVKHFTFEDEVLSPSAAAKISDGIIERGLEVKLSSNIRLEKQFTPQLCAKMSKAGFRLLYLGFESGCQRVLNLMDKGTTLATGAEVIRNVYNAGIWPHLYIMFGFPGESTAEAQQTIDFLLSHRDIIRSFHTENFVLTKGSVAQTQPERFGISIDQSSAADFNGNLAFTQDGGMTPAQALDLATGTMDGPAGEFAGDRILEAVGHFYLPIYLSHFDSIEAFIRSADRPATQRLELPTVDVSAQSCPRLKRSVMMQRLSFNLMAIRQTILEGKMGATVYPEKTILLFNRDGGGFRAISDQAAEILSLCSGQRTVADIAGRMAKKYDAPAHAIQADCLLVLQSFAREGYLEGVVYSALLNMR